MLEQRSPEWFKQRIGRITASKVGAIIGVNPCQSAEDVLRAMVREYHGAPSEFEGNSATAWGTANEDGAILDYTLDTGRTVEPAFFEPVDDWLGASPDGYVGADGLIEIKCPFGKREITDASEFKPLSEQPQYYAQIQFQLFCTGRNWCDFYQWSPAFTKLERVEFDPTWWTENAQKLVDFYQLYLSELDNPEHLKEKRKIIESDEAKTLVEQYFDAKARKDAADKEMKAILKQLAEEAGDTDAQIGKHKLTRVERAGSVSYSKVVKELLPDVDMEAYRGKPSSYWRLS